MKHQETKPGDWMLADIGKLDLMVDRFVMEDYKDTDSSDKCCWYFDRSLNRFVATLFISGFGFFYSASFHTPGSLEAEIENIFSIKAYQFQLLYSVYSIPNVIVLCFTGLLVDKVLGLKLGSLIFVYLAFVGQIIIVGGGFSLTYIVMLIGRFVYGLGAESAMVCVTCFFIIWFRRQELNFIFGLFQSMTSLGIFFIFYISKPTNQYASIAVTNHFVLGISLIPSLLMVLLLLICTAFLGCFTQKNSKHLTSFKKEKKTLKIKQIYTFPVVYWLLAIMIAINSGIIVTFASRSQELLKTRYDLANSEAIRFTNFLNCSGALIAPTIGLVVDKIGKNILICFFTFLLGILAQMIFSFTDWSPYIPLFLFSIYFGVMSSCALPLVSRVVKQYQMATAYGIVQCFMNLSYSINNILSHIILESYGPMCIASLVTGLLFLGLICCGLVYILDFKGGCLLNLKSANTILIKERLNNHRI